MTDTNEILDRANQEINKWRDYIRDGARAFHEEEGELFTRNEAVNFVQEHLDIDKTVAKDVVSNLVSDTIDPVIQVPFDNEKYVGVVDYAEFDGAYGYIDFHDNWGKRRRVVCAECVHEADHEYEVTHATAGDPDGSFADSPDASYSELLEAIHEHYKESHSEIPENVETGASLASPTTIGGNTAFHAGNDGSGSNLDADTVDGYSGAELANNVAAGTSTPNSSNYSGWIDTNLSPPVYKTYNGSSWVKAGDRIETISGTINSDTDHTGMSGDGSILESTVIGSLPSDVSLCRMKFDIEADGRVAHGGSLVGVGVQADNSTGTFGRWDDSNVVYRFLTEPSDYDRYENALLQFNSTTVTTMRAVIDSGWFTETGISKFLRGSTVDMNIVDQRGGTETDERINRIAATGTIYYK